MEGKYPSKLLKSTTNQRFEKGRERVRIVTRIILGFNFLLLFATIFTFWARLREWKRSELTATNELEEDWIKIASSLAPVALAFFVSIHQIATCTKLADVTEEFISREKAIEIVFSHLHSQMFILVAELLMLFQFAYNGLANNSWDPVNMSCIGIMLTMCSARVAGWIIVHNFGNWLQIALIRNSGSQAGTTKPIFNT